MKIRPLKNAHRDVTTCLRRGHNTTAAIVKAMWPTSKQPAKKAKTVEKYLCQLAQSGTIRQVANVWVIL